MHEPADDPTDAFVAHRPRLLGIATRMLGSAADAEDAVQDAWLRYRRTDIATIDNLGAWLTTVVSRICLNTLRSRGVRREEELDIRLETEAPSSTVTPTDPADEAALADAVGVGLLLVLDTLAPAERIAFVLHDLFAVPFDEIAPVIDKSVDATRQLASRARRRIQGTAPTTAGGAPERRAVVDAFFAAARRGDLGALVGLLAPDIVLRSDGGTALPAATAHVSGPDAVASRALMFSRPDADLVPASIDGRTGVVVVVDGTVIAVMSFDVVDGVITAIDSLADPDRLASVDIGER